jgi:glycosyltransferase involved in cell wall biosynthesis
MKLSIIIPSCNEGEQTLKTVQNIKENCKKSNYEIIVINDYSDTGKWVNLPKYVKTIENPTRLGRPASLQVGIDNAKYENILMLNARMRFNSDFVESYLQELKKHKGLLCSACVYLTFEDVWVVKGEKTHIFSVRDYDRKALEKHLKSIKYESIYREKGDEITENKQRKFGANINFYDPDSRFKFFNLSWNNTKPEDGRVNVCLGASTATTKSWWSYIHGLKGLHSWGSADTFLSLKTWIAGGQCRILDCEIGNIFRRAQHYPFNPIDTLYNKMYMTHVLMPMKYRKYMLPNEPENKKFKLFKHYQLALNWYLNTLGKIEQERQYIKSIRVNNVMNFIKEGRDGNNNKIE